MPSSFVSRANDGIDLTGIESSLQCIDAEILAVDKESLVLRSFVAELQGDQTLAKTEAMIQQAVAAAESNAERINEWNRQVSPQKNQRHSGLHGDLAGDQQGSASYGESMSSGL